jgi:SAM-dependent methyltransferase
MEDLVMSASGEVPSGARCLSCGNKALTPILSLGMLPLANAYPRVSDPREEPRFPLDLAFCHDCCLVQLTHVVPRDQLFSEYLYFSSYSNSMLQHAQQLVRQLVEERGLGADSLAVEVASNDGYLLQYFKQSGVSVLGVEPATNIARCAVEERDIPTVNAFFDEQLATDLRQENPEGADVVLALNVLAHIDDLNGFVRGIGIMLKNAGIAVIEVPYVRDMIERTEFDTIYHEHLCYFSVHSVAKLVSRHGLMLKRVERVTLHGGSLRLYVGRGAEHGPTAQKILAEERELGLDCEDFYADFGRRVKALKESLNATVERLRKEGGRIAGYGAAAKGTILLNYCGLDNDTIVFVADRNPHKQGRRIPGCGIPIYAPDAIAEQHPDYVLLLVWNLRDEILKQERSYLESGGRFIVPVPKVELV